MQRRDFIKNTSLSAFVLCTPGFVRFDGQRYVGDCETTSDILGPFYRPDSPVRTNLVILGEKGEPIQLFGKIIHDDCFTPYKKAKVELWHCDGSGEYDNASAEFKYRGTTYSDDKGNYSFDTILPVPYGSGDNYRPAHFHMMITAEGYQPLVTQLYFKGDPWISKDSSSSSPTAKNRILEVQSLKNGSKKVEYNISMAKKLAVEPASIDRLIGSYTNEKDPKNKMEFFKKDNQLWLKGDPFGMNFDYVGNNTFQIPGMSIEKLFFVFEIMDGGMAKLTETYVNDKGEKEISVYVRAN